MKEKIHQWLKAGCPLTEGLKLLETYSKNKLLVRMVKIDPAKGLALMVKELSSLAGLEADKTTASSQEKVRGFRDEFPFLNEPGCPMELRALVTDKFSSFYRYRDLHKGLSDCTTAKDCANNCRLLIDNYLENRAIYDELDYYKKHGTVLGRHHIFKHMNKMKALRKMSIKELVEKQIRLEHNIWRIESELKKQDKPHLEKERSRRLKEKMAELAEVKRLLN